MIIALVGAESTGKTTLAAALAQRLGGVCVGEVLREWCDREGRTPREHEQLSIAEEQGRRIVAAAQGADIVVADTAPLQIAVYSDFVFDDPSLYAPALAWHAQHVSHTLLTALDLPWCADGLQRDGPHVRAPVDERLRRALGDAGLSFGVIHGDGDRRLDAALGALQWREVNAANDAALTQEGRRWRPRCLDCLDPNCEQMLHRRRSLFG